MKNIPCFIIIFLLIGCSSSLLTRQDYHPSLLAFHQGSPQKALEKFPEGESDSFITSLEKAYLNLLQGKPKIDDLIKRAEILENRVRYKVSRELKSLFYVETPEGYYASEHEVVWLHFLLSWGYSLRGEYEKGCVEARKSAHLLNSPWSEEGGFDDPMARVFLGALWAMCGSWDEARVDFRAANLLNPSLDWAKRLADREYPPKNLIVILGGVGPVVYWKPEAKLNPIRGFRSLAFQPQGKRSPVKIQDSLQTTIIPYLSPDSSPWYIRHFARDNEIHDLIKDSQYSGEALGIVTMESAKIALGVTTGVVIITGSIGVGAAIIYYGNSSSAVELGAMVAVLGSVYGARLAARTAEDGIEKMQKGLDPSDQYRFARFLPEYIWIGWTEKDLSPPLTLRLPKGGGKQKTAVPAFQTFSRDKSKTWLGSFADMGVVSFNSLILATGEKWKKWSEGVKAAISRRNNGKGWGKLENMLREAYLLKGASKVSAYYADYSLDFSEMSVRIERKKGLFHQNQAILIDLDSKEIKPDSQKVFSFLTEKPHRFSSLIENCLRHRIKYLKEKAKSDKKRKNNIETSQSHIDIRNPATPAVNMETQ